MKPLAECLLYTFIDAAYLRGRSPEWVAAQLAEGGSDLVQLRAKGAPPEEVRQLADKIQPVLAAANVGLVINDYPEIAAAVGAPFCHLGQEDFFDAGYAHVDQVLARSGSDPLSPNPVQIGLSTHGPTQAERAWATGAAYLAVGPVFATPTKPTAKPVTLDYVRWASVHVPMPWFAIGGINLENLDEVLAAGARRVCVVSAILAAPDLVQACQAFKQRLLSRRHDGP